MRKLLFWSLAFCLTISLSPAIGQDNDAGKKDMESLQGTWRGVKGPGSPKTDERAKNVKFVVKGDKMTMIDSNPDQKSEKEGTIKLDPKTRAFAWTDAKNGWIGIYELKGDDFRFYVVPRLGDPKVIQPKRPKSFDDKTEGAQLFVLKRVTALKGTSKKPLARVDSQDLAQVPEIFFEPAFAEPIKAEDAKVRITDAVNKANRLNTKKIDGFVEDVRKSRPDLKGLPFVMGDDCRLTANRLRPFASAGESVHQAIAHVRSKDSKLIPNAGTVLMDAFQRGYVEAEGKDEPLPDPNVAAARTFLPSGLLLALQVLKGVDMKMAGPEHAKKQVAAAQIAALMQVLAPESAELRVGLANYLGRMPHPEATRALARLAIFSEEAEVRQAACKALLTRDAKDYTDILVDGLNYPWPAVAESASQAIVQLKRTELIPQLISMLEQPDPRAPKTKETDGKNVLEVRELVRINHHRNCLLCHASGNTADVPTDAIKAGISVPGEPFPSPGKYGDAPPNADHVVRIDVTYLRQDFSRRLPIADFAPWPDNQRFDFVVRTRILKGQEIQAYQQYAGDLSPYHRAAVIALRELTGRDAEPTAAAWRRLLGMKKGE